MSWACDPDQQQIERELVQTRKTIDGDYESVLSKAFKGRPIKNLS